MFKISVFTVMIPDLTPEQAGQALRQHGYDGVEWRVATPNFSTSQPPSFWANNFCTLAPTVEEAHRAKAIADAHNLGVPGLGTYIDVGNVAAVEQAMIFAQITGARNVRVNPGRWPDPDGLSYADSFDRAKRFLADCEALGKRTGVRTIIEMHHGTIVCSAGLSHRLVAAFDPDYIGVLHDAGNCVHEGFENYDMGIQLLGPYLAHVHIKNAAYDRPASGGVWTSRWAPLEDGVVNWDNLFGALKKANYQGWLGIEDFSAVRPTAEALPYNLQFLKNAIDRVYNA
jgi:sugar phosphate isomerase/epimerase